MLKIFTYFCFTGKSGERKDFTLFELIVPLSSPENYAQVLVLKRFTNYLMRNTLTKTGNLYSHRRCRTWRLLRILRNCKKWHDRFSIAGYLLKMSKTTSRNALLKHTYTFFDGYSDTFFLSAFFKVSFIYLLLLYETI